MNKYICNECSSEFQSKDFKNAFCPTCESPNVQRIFTKKELEIMNSQCGSGCSSCKGSCH